MFDLPCVGKLNLEHTFYALDDPVLFVCKDMTGVHYLCSCCKLGEEWVVGQVSETALVNMIDDKITIRDVFEKKCSTKFHVTWDGEKFSITDKITNDSLPRVGAMLELAHERYNRYRKNL